MRMWKKKEASKRGRKRKGERNVALFVRLKYPESTNNRERPGLCRFNK
jgi:hypothetical protein